MAIQDLGTRDQYVATSGQTIFPYTFEIFDKDDVTVEQNGTALTEGTHYTVSGVGVDAGGNITLVAGAATGDILTIYRDMALERLTDYQNSGDFLASDVNDDFDRVWAALQQNKNGADLAIRANTTDTALNSTNLTLASITTRANKALGFTSKGLLDYISGTMPVGTLRNYANMTSLVADIANTVIGDRAYLDERSTGNGGGAWWKVVDATTVTENGFDIVAGDATRSLQLIYSNHIDVRQLGAKDDGTTDNTTIITYAATLGIDVEISGGVYIVVYDNIVCADGTRVYGNGTLKDLSTPTLPNGSPNRGFIRVTTNNEISGLSFIGASNKLFAVTGKSSTAVGTVKNIRVSNLKTTECGIFIAEPEQGFTFNNTEDVFVSWILSGPITSDMISEDIVVKDCHMEGDVTYTPSTGNTNSSQAHGVVFNYAKNCESINNHIKNCRFANWAYGGGVLRSDGYTASLNTLWNENIKFIGGSAAHCFSTYWMSKTKNGVISSTTSYDYQDVVIDFEGCDNCAGIGNSTNDIGYGAGALTALAGCSNITFTGNACTISAGASVNMSNSFIGNKNIIWDSNVFSAYGSATPKLIIRNSVSAGSTVSPTTSKNIQVTNNQFIKVDCLFESLEDINFSGNRQSTPTNINAVRYFNIIDVISKNNTLDLTTNSALSTQANSPIQSVLSGKTYTRVEMSGNNIYGTTGESGITIFGSPLSTGAVDVSNNKVNAIFLDNAFIFSAPNQIQGKIILKGNHLPLAIDTTHIGTSVVKSTGGTEAVNPFITYGNSTPTAGTWKAGDIIYDSTPSASGFLGWICTVTGTPGTWKTFGAISA